MRIQGWLHGTERGRWPRRRPGRGALSATVLCVLALALALCSSASAAQLFAFGDNGSGQLGTGATSTTPNFTPAPASLPGASGTVVQAAAGDFHSLAVTSGGQLYTFGSNGFGQLGVSPASGSFPTPTQVTLPGATGPVAQASAGEAFSVAITTTGQLYTFGSNRFGQLGTSVNSGTSDPTPTPTAIGLPGATGPVVQVAAGGVHTLALTSTGQVYGFGANFSGESGGPIGSQPAPTPRQISFPGATGPIVQIAAGEAFSLGVTSTGQLFGWGSNNLGELAKEVQPNSENPHPTPEVIALPGATGSVAQVAGSDSATYAVTTTGQLFTFGDNTYGELGRPENAGVEAPNPVPGQVQLPGATGGVVQAAGGRRQGYALTSTGQLFSFGYNLYGQLGYPLDAGTGNANPTAAQVGLPAGMPALGVAFAGMASHALALVGAAAGVPAGGGPLPGTSATPGSSSSISIARIKSSLLTQLIPGGKAAKIGVLRKRKSYTSVFAALSPGALAIAWYLVPAGAHLSKKAKPKPVLLARGAQSFKTAGSKAITIKLTKEGLRRLRTAKRIKLTVKGVFTPSGKAPVTALRQFSLKR
jgi:alpha-tubulin suppressor-like RCC1 family protein